MNRVYVVGIGPGAGKQMTEEAREVLNACDTIIGYTVYVDLVKEQFRERISDHADEAGSEAVQDGI